MSRTAHTYETQIKTGRHNQLTSCKLLRVNHSHNARFSDEIIQHVITSLDNELQKLAHRNALNWHS